MTFLKSLSAAFLLFALLAGSTGCSNQMIYNFIQSSNRSECDRLVGAQRLDCLDRVNLSYNEYLSAREFTETPAIASADNKH